MRSGTGQLFSLLVILVGCRALISSPQKVSLEIRNVYDVTYQEMYEEISLYCDFPTYPDMFGVFLTSSLLPQLQIRLPLSFKENFSEHLFSAKQKGIRFSLFEEYVPRGLYFLIFQGKIGQEERISLSLNNPFSLRELNSYFRLERNTLYLKAQKNERWREFHINSQGQILVEKEMANEEFLINLDSLKPAKETSVIDFEIQTQGKIFVVRINLN